MQRARRGWGPRASRAAVSGCTAVLLSACAISVPLELEADAGLANDQVEVGPRARSADAATPGPGVARRDAGALAASPEGTTPSSNTDPAPGDGTAGTSPSGTDAAKWRVPTGQVRCYADDVVPCGPLPCDADGGPALCGQDAQYDGRAKRYTCATLLGAAPVQCADYAASESFATDEDTGFRWERVATPDLTWEEAKQRCAELPATGATGVWHLPTLHELHTLVDHDRFEPSTDPIVFPDTPFTDFPDPGTWSASEVADDPDSAWTLDFGHSFSRAEAKTVRAAARCVRGTLGTFSGERFLILDPRVDVIDDRLTGQQWTGTSIDFEEWSDALAYCERLQLGGHDDWRLPNIRELVMLIDPARSHPASALPGLGDERLISSTSDPYEAYISAYEVEFDTGWIGSFEKFFANARCTRDAR